MRHRLLFALGRGKATISQLAVTLGSNKGNIAHHLRVLTDAGLVQPAGTRQVRGGTGQCSRCASRRLSYDDAATIEVTFRALAAEIAAAEPEPFVVLRTLRLTPEHAEQLSATLRDLADQAEDADDQPKYGLLLGLYQAGAAALAGPAQPGTPTTGPPAAGEAPRSCRLCVLCSFGFAGQVGPRDVEFGPQGQAISSPGPRPARRRRDGTRPRPRSGWPRKPDR